MRRNDGVLAAGLVLGWVADQVFGDPRRGHPVAGFGRVAAALERRLYSDDRAHGVLFEAMLVGGTLGLGWSVRRVVRDRPLLGLLATGVSTWAVLGGRSLTRESEGIAAALSAADLPAARRRVRNLVSRDPETLDAAGIARATLESVAENTSDAVVAPLFWGAVAGVPGLLAYRAVNTLDAMVGYRNERYRAFGWAAARLDDLANWVPARLAAGLTIAAAPLVGGSAADAIRAVREQSGRHPSPNGGVVEAAFAGALGVRLGGRNVYDGVEEDRGELGFGRRPRPGDLRRADALAVIVSAGSVATCAALALLREGWSLPRRGGLFRREVGHLVHGGTGR
ncbi:cobalamin biosynthesis protein [Propionicicella superfundia]|uniref:cobalamin biosynthesis protein n=1 Tax=Propionicicella superfundia TaxID=348582 RepID=UPI000412A26A|nr:cobalamin biosynthesis protein [Propionicicella superfundia]